MQVYCSIDWLSVTTPHNRGLLSPKTLMADRVHKKGRLGYKECYLYENGIAHLWSDDRPESHVIYTGKVLKTISEVMTIQNLVQWHYDLGHRVSRIDTAIDALDSGATVADYADMWKLGKCDTRAKSGLLISDPRGETGDTLYIGSTKKRRKLLRIYDKAKEQRIDKDWLRFEMQYGQGAARSCARQIAGSESLEMTVKAQMRGFARFPDELYSTITGNRDMTVSHDMPSGASRRLEWLWKSVIPALIEQEKDTPGITRLLMNEVNDRIGERSNE